MRVCVCVSVCLILRLADCRVNVIEVTCLVSKTSPDHSRKDRKGANHKKERVQTGNGKHAKDKRERGQKQAREYVLH